MILLFLLMDSVAKIPHPCNFERRLRIAEVLFVTCARFAIITRGYNRHTMCRWCDEPAPTLLLDGTRQFNHGDYFEQHETFERLWKEEQRDVRRLYQGILQIGVAMYHLQNCNHHGAVYMLRRGSMYLEAFTPRCQSVDVANLLVQASRILQVVERLGPAKLKQFDWGLAPRIRLTE